MKKPVVAILFTLFIITHSFSQKTEVYIERDADLKKGLELFQKEKYGAAQHQFQKVIKTHKDLTTIARVDAEFYNAICATELFHKNAELLLRKFIAEHPESPRIKTAYFNLGRYNYRKKDYKDALDCFSKVDIYDLDKKLRHEFIFKRGYCYFELDSISKAKNDFYEIKDVDNKFAAPATYYFSHLAYNENNFETALSGFKKLLSNDDFGPVVPYYVVQIYFLQEKFNEAIEFGTPLLDSASTKRAPEIARIIGESYYKTERYKESIPYFKKYEKRVVTLSKEDSYQLAYAYYKNNEIDNAMIYFQGAASNQDEDLVNQSAYYHLADCYIKKGNKKFARSAFYAASKTDFDKNIKEDALFSYAKLGYELGYDPYNETIEAFKNYLEQFPDSYRKDEAYNYLINTYLTTKNYAEAIRSMEHINSPNDEIKLAYQKVTYLRAVDFYNNNQIDSALKYFDKSLNYENDKKINALAHYWKGESFYKKGLYDLAIHNYKEFMGYPGSFDMPEYNNCNYNTGYCYFKMQDYSSANIAFRKFTDFKSVGNEAKKQNDAYNRAGDTYFMLKQYEDAISYYNKAIAINLIDKDHTLYQRALASGVLKKFDDKITDLQSVVKNYPKSTYIPAAIFELAKTFNQQNDKQNEALSYYKKIIDEHVNSSYYIKSLLQAGQIHYNKKEDDKALAYFDKVVAGDKSSVEAYEALGFIRNIFSANGDIDGLEEHLNNLNYSLATSTLDSLSFDIGKKHYQEKNCDNAINSFEKYIEKYANGRYALEAIYYKADCELKKGNSEKALADFIALANKNKNKYTEPSLANITQIFIKQKNCKDAIAYFEKLEAIAEYPKNILDSRYGQMKCHFESDNYVSAANASKRLLTIEKLTISVSEEAQLISGMCALETENYDAALEQFASLAQNSNSDKGIEARYYTAYILFLKSEFKESEKKIFELVQQEPSNAYWMSKALILLADCYTVQNDNFQAKQTLESVIENTEDITIKKEAEQKLNNIIEKEKSHVPALSTEEIKIEFKQNKLEYNNLYNEPVIYEGTIQQ